MVAWVEIAAARVGPGMPGIRGVVSGLGTVHPWVRRVGPWGGRYGCRRGKAGFENVSHRNLNWCSILEDHYASCLQEMRRGARVHGPRQRRQIVKFFCEALREMGMLIMVFAALDRTFNSAISTGALLAWLLVGFAALLTGIYA